MANEINPYKPYVDATVTSTNALLRALVDGFGFSGSGNAWLLNSRPTAQQLGVPITTIDGNDGIALDAFANCVILAAYAKLTGGAWVNVTTGAGFTPVGVNNLDTVMLTAAFQTEAPANSFNLNFALTGVGSSLQWTAGTFDTGEDVIVIYLNNAAIVNPVSSMISFTTSNNVTTYNLGSAVAGFSSGYLVFGNSNLQYSGGSADPAPGKFSISGNNIILNNGGVIPAGFICFLVINS